MKDKFAVSMFGQKRLSREGGIEIVVKELCTRMARDGCQVTCYNRSGHHVKDDNRIIFTGFVQGQMLDELYSNAYIYTLPSDLEGMPLSLLEAMSYGNCCLVSDIPACAEVVEDKALIFKKSDVDELREKLQDACDYPENVYSTNRIDVASSKRTCFTH